ncbi:hypothetical protein [Thermomonospora amylolytica]|uniref:hypothetical protein n=1 Tax=Thermomonospora amylolytica TaxID=1411117 RepID=UPI0013002A68|nr:hypothetical protein [Thermomonospora amylolytica]
MIRRLGALLIAMPVATGVILTGTPGSANAIWGRVTAPADGTVITSGTQVTARAEYSGLNMQLRVTVPGAGDQFLTSGGWSGTLSAPIGIGVNGRYTVRLVGGITKHPYDTSTFTVRIPPAAPSGVSASASGNTLTVTWNLGLEDDLTGYKVDAGSHGSKSGSTGAFCSGTVCSHKFTLASGSTGSATVSVRAVRSNGTGGTITSGPSSRTVQLAGPGGGGGGGAGGTGGGGVSVGNLPAPNYNAGNGGTPLTPFNEQSPVTLPNVQPDGANPNFAYPEPVVAGQNAGGQDPAALTRLQWSKSIAIALILLVIAAHLGTWTRRMRVAQAGVSSLGMAARIARSGSGRTRVEKTQEHIARAEATAKASTATKPRPAKDAGSRSATPTRQPGTKTRTTAQAGKTGGTATATRTPRPTTPPANAPTGAVSVKTADSTAGTDSPAPEEPATASYRQPAPRSHLPPPTRPVHQSGCTSTALPSDRRIPPHHARRPAPPQAPTAIAEREPRRGSSQAARCSCRLCSSAMSASTGVR